MDKAKEALKEGEILQVNGIVDCSEHGWAVVEEYDKHELAENYNDKKRLYRAELHAGRKIKAAAAKNKKKKMAIGRTGDQDFSKVLLRVQVSMVLLCLCSIPPPQPLLLRRSLLFKVLDLASMWEDGSFY